MSSSDRGESNARSPWWHPPAAFLGRWILRTLWGTYRYRAAPASAASAPTDLRDSESVETTSKIHLCWHDQTALCGPYFIRRIHHHSSPLALMTSQSRDGELVTRCLRPFGLQIVRGSATRGGRDALRALYRVVRKEGASPLILPDGPQGPLHVVKPGAVVLSQMTGAPLIPYGFAARSAWTLGSWDRMRLAKPGAKIAIVRGDEVMVPRELPDPERDALCDELGQTLTDLTRQATALLGET